MPVQVTGYGGINEIGGSKLLLEDGDLRLFLDFGMPFGRYGSYFDGVFIKERVTRGLLDLLALGLLPPLRGLLRSDLIPGLSPQDLDVTTHAPSSRQRKPHDDVRLTARGEDAFWAHWQQHAPTSYRDMRRPNARAVDAVLLSHAHQDHIANTVYLAMDIPCVSSRMTAFISKVLADSGMDGQGAAYSNPYALSGEGLLSADKSGQYSGRPWRFVDGEPAGEADADTLDSALAFWDSSPAARKQMTRLTCTLPATLPIRSWPVDHSLFGATGYAVQTSAGWVAYSGDLRMHGREGARSLAFAEALRALHPVALLCEGTRLDSTSSTTEAEVHDACLGVVRAAGKLVVADFAARNVERLECFIDIAARTRRRLLVQPKDAYLLRAMHLADPAAVADWMSTPSVALYADPKSVLRAWESGIRSRYASRTVGHLEVSRNPGDYILAFSLNDAADLLDIHACGDISGGIYLFSNSAAYDDEQKVDLERLWNWVDYLGLRMVGLERPRRNEGGALVVSQQPGFHSSGHAGQPDLVAFVRTVAPKTLIPIHTEHAELWPDLLSGSGINIIMPEFFKPIVLG